MGRSMNQLIKKSVTIVVPVHNESRGLFNFFEKLNQVLLSLDNYEWCVLFIDDGSTDDSWGIIEQLSLTDSKVKALALSRNFGKEIALTAGVEYLDGKVDAAIFMDADLQHPPEILPEILKRWEDGFEVVATIREQSPSSSLVRRVGARVFYSMMSKFADVEITPNGTDYRLLDKKVIKELSLFTERTRMFRGLIDWMGFRKTHIKFTAAERAHDTPSYTLHKLIGLAINSLTSFSLLPLRLTGYMGLFIIFSTLLMIMYMLTAQILHWDYFTPLAFVVVFNTFLIGILLSGLGLVALYIGHIHTEVVKRPLYLIREIK
ncbi:MAG: glycosyl transferase [Gammaproteobacteria bacterium CG22_combo_CG10-13_8_21_14_all_40_8]|nr:MAG: glycosyl transferase [Gammaproteobacteria bacterium CG22_combo_CG10-13_8_21_14_all_40_8]